MKLKNIKFDRDLLEKIEKEAERRGLTFSSCLKRLAAERLAQGEK